MLARGECPFCLPGKTCLLCQGDFERIAEHLRPHFRPRAETCSDGRGGQRPSWYQGDRANGSGRREAPARAEARIAPLRRGHTVST